MKKVLSKLFTLWFGNTGIHFRFTSNLDQEKQSIYMYNFAFKTYRSSKCGFSCTQMDVWISLTAGGVKGVNIDVCNYDFLLYSV
jgi:hypothetical protein